MIEKTVVVAFFLQPSDTPGGQASDVIDLASTEKYENLLRDELQLPDAQVRVFGVGDWDAPPLRTAEDLEDGGVFAEFAARAARALMQLRVADAVVAGFAEGTFARLTLPASGRVILFQAITAPSEELGDLVTTDVGSAATVEQLDQLDPEGMKNFLGVLSGADQAASHARDGFFLDQNSTWPTAMLAEIATRYVSLNAPRSQEVMHKAWAEHVERFMFRHCEGFTDGLKLTMDDPETSLAKLALKLCHRTFKINRLDADAAQLIHQALDTLEQETGRTYASQIGQVRKKMEEEAAKGGCFVATVVYGDADAHELHTLRQFRDRVLLNRRWGRVFVRSYYAHGPALASFVKRHRFLQPPIRRVLDGIVRIIAARLR